MQSIFSALIAINLICVVMFAVAGIKNKKFHFYKLSLLNICAFLFNFATYLLHVSSTAQEAIHFARMHTNAILIFVPFFSYFFASWCDFKHTKLYIFVLSSICSILLLYNNTSDSLVRYGSNPEVHQYVNLFNETTSIVLSNGDFSKIFNGLFAVNFIVILLICLKNFNRNNSIINLAVLGTIIAQIGSSIVGYHIDKNISSLIYVGGVPITLFSMIYAFHISKLFTDAQRDLRRTAFQKNKLEQALTKLAELPSGQLIYFETMNILYKFSHADFIIIGKINHQKSSVDVEYAINKGNSLPPFSYDLDGTPCKDVFGSGACFYSNVSKYFPNDQFLIDNNIQSYIGYPILEHNISYGIIVALFEKNIDEDDSLKNIMGVVSARLSAEFQKQKLTAELRHLAYHDKLTQLPNRESLIQSLKQVHRNSIHYKYNSLLALFDLDHFGDVNRKYGYHVADQVISMVGLRLAELASAKVVVARQSGDEFAIVIEQIQMPFEQSIKQLWQQLQMILTAEFCVGNRVISLDFSMGAVVFPSQIQTENDIVTAAEHALEQAKRNGRNHYCLFSPELKQKLEQKQQLEHDLKYAIHQENQLFLVYQPKYNSQQHICGVEALLRWKHPLHGFISPIEFICLAEETGLIFELGAYTLKMACQFITHANSQNICLPRIAINVSANEFERTDYYDQFFAQLHQYNIATTALEIELTETSLLQNPVHAIEQLTRFKESGIRVSLDDFGTGYSSLAYLKDLPLDTLKLDRAFIQSIEQPKTYALLGAMINIAKQLSLDTIAEGTETYEQVQKLLALGCEQFQGYYFSKPLLAQDFLQLLYTEQHIARVMPNCLD